jgi:signal transduction histidine kinase
VFGGADKFSMSAAPPTESATATLIDLELVGVAAAALDYSNAAERLGRLTDPSDALEDPWVVHELASTVTVLGMNHRAGVALGIAPGTRCPGQVFSMFEATSEMLDSFKAQFVEMLAGSLTSQTEQRLSDRRIILVDWKAADTSYRNVVVTLRDVTAARDAAARWDLVSAQMSRLGRASNTIARRLDMFEVRRETVSQVCRVLECDGAALVTVDRDRGEIEDFIAVAASDNMALHAPTWPEFQSGVGGRVLEDGTTRTENVVDPSEHEHVCSLVPGAASAIATPLNADHEYASVVIGIRNGTDRPFNDADVAAIELLAGSAARATENARLYESISEESAKLSKAKREVTSAYDQLATAQAQLLQAQKLEAIGELASGIAHEINTPIQFIGDNAQFLSDVTPDVARFHREALRLAELARNVPDLEEPATAVTAAAEAADLAFTDEEIADALAQIREGVARVAGIVRAMKDFAHQGGDAKTPIDLNATIETTIAVARNEWKYHCEVGLDLDDGLPPVPALAGPLKQAILVIIINAAQAVQDAVGDSGKKGTIAISTSQRGDDAVLKITDSGLGIPEKIRDRIFDPFFTTKEVGRGSGQGLTICRSAIVDQHGGTLEFETEEGVGTTFIVTLPLHIGEEPT